MRQFRNAHPIPHPAAVPTLVATGVALLLAGAYADGALGGVAGLAVGGAGFVAYLVLTARAFRLRLAGRGAGNQDVGRL